MPSTSLLGADLLRLMITGSHPLDMKLARLCLQNMRFDSSDDDCADLLQKMDIIDTAYLFRAPALLMSGLRQEALRALEKVVLEPQSQEIGKLG